MRNLTWLQDVSDYISSCKDTQFEWGVFDCCLFAANCCKLIANSDPAEAYRGKYNTELGAKRTLSVIHGSLAGAFGALYSEVSPAMAQRGDVVLFETELGETAGIQWSGGVWAVGVNGVVFLTPEVTKAWRVE